ncbi:integrase family protein [Segniliparus rotundus DSM 44985]|uniref:Integrase family protein n=1 Tax=Segniliparus rotundus (strain ATCC BAA-972 / CDC 1076 / CIP 108378 / DSM 44985 / JCM 13578) TaxID=640132 RepID=D6ZFD9_SEGRD|nr:site-specific integrase [Segniliparus rotundus]ADG97663.1 integrase family protein [Segniliparus rotundus DSM 44985]
MPRPATPLGCYGKINTKEARPGHWTASTWFRDWDGESRLVKSSGPTKAKAENALKKKLQDRQTPASGDLVTPDTTVAVLWAEFRNQLVERQKEGSISEGTIDQYDRAAKKIQKGLGQVRIKELKVQLLHNFLRALPKGSAHHCRTILSGMLALAVRYEALPTNPMRDVPKTTAGKRARGSESAQRPKGIDDETVERILDAIMTSDAPCPQIGPGGVPTPRSAYARKHSPDPTLSQYAQDADLVDVITFLLGTGIRIGEALGVLWTDVDFEKRILTLSGKAVRVKGRGMVRESHTKTEAGDGRPIELPGFVLDMLQRRKAQRHLIGASGFRHPGKIRTDEEQLDLVFPAANGGVRDMNNTQRQWRRVRAALELHWVVPHAFRKTVSTAIDEGGLSARVAADQLGHAKVSMTQDVYMARWKPHPEAAQLLDERFGAMVKTIRKHDFNEEEAVA